MNKLLLTYLPYGAIDVLLTIAIISELVNKRFDLLWANVPILLWGLYSLSTRMKQQQHDLAD